MGFTYKYFHPLVETIVHYQRMAHADPGGLHARPPQCVGFTLTVTENWNVRVSRTIVKSPDVRVEEITLYR